MKRESKFSSYLRPLLREAGWLVQAVETGETGAGVPDLYLVKQGVSGWMELKVMDVGWPTTRCVPFRPAQWPWLHTHHKHGGRSWLGVKLLTGYVFCTIEEVDEYAHTINEQGRSTMYLPRLNMRMLDMWLLKS